MALPRSTVSIPLATSLNQKTDSKMLAAGQLAISKNTQFNKEGAVDKRSGFTTLPTTVVSSFPNPLPIAASNSRSFGFAHDSQIGLQNNGTLYTYYQGQTEWIAKSNYLPVEITSQSCVANSKSQVFSECGIVNGITVIAYDAEYPGNKVGYSVIEEATGSFLVKEGVISSAVNASNAKVVCFSNAIYICYVEGTNLKAAKISLIDGSVLATTVVRSDVTSDAASSFISAARQTDWAVTAGSAIGEAALFMYMTSTGYSIGIMDVNGAFVSTLGVLTIAATGENQGFTIHVDPSVDVNRFYVCYWDLSTFKIKMSSWTIGAGAFSSVFANVVVYTTAGRSGVAYEYIKSIALITHPQIAGSLLVLADTDENLAIGTSAFNRNYEARIYSAVISSVGTVVTAGSALCFGFCLIAKPFKDPNRSTIYIPVVYDSDIQASFFLLDYSHRTSIGALSVVAKWQYGNAGGRLPTGVLGACRLVSGSIFAFTSMVKSGIANPNAQFLTKWQTGIKRFLINLAPTFASSTNLLGGTTHISGGFMHAYDGSAYSEHGFFYDPETPIGSGQSSLFTVQFTQGTGSGSSGTYATTLVTFTSPGLAFKNSTGVFKFSSTSTNYRVWVSVDGVGSDPGGSETSIPLALSALDSPFDVGNKLCGAIAASGAAVTASVGSVVVGQCTIIIACTTISTTVTASSSTLAFGTPNGYGQSLATGNYQYSVVWKWVDSAGRIYRSAPSIGVTISNVLNTAITLFISCPPITNRDASKVVAEIYRTTSNGTVLRKVSSFPTDAGTWSLSNNRITFVDGVSDGFQAAGEALYTTGGVLDNFQIPAFKVQTRYKGRIVVAGVDDPLTIYYSKPLISGSPLNFAQELSIQVDADNSAISGLATMDEKLIVFKKDHIYYLAGDPPNALGTGSTLSSPIQIASDVGCVNHASIVAYPDGLIFKSQKGLYKLGRNLVVSYIGSPVDDYNAFTISSATLVANRNEIRFTHQDTPDAIIYNYLLDIWAVWTNYQSDSAFDANGTYARVKNNGKVQLETVGIYQEVDGTSANIRREIELPWLKVKGHQDFQRIYNLSLLGDYFNPHVLTFTLSYDYDTNPANAVTYTWDTSQTLLGSGRGDQTYQPQIKPSVQKCEAIKVNIVENGAGRSATWSDLALECGLKVGIAKTKSEKSI